MLLHLTFLLSRPVIFFLGVGNLVVKDLSDNTLTVDTIPQGIWYSNGSPNWKPSGITYTGGFVIVLKNAAAKIILYFDCMNNKNIYCRAGWDGNWIDWRTL